MTYDDALEKLVTLDPQWSAWGSDGLQNHTTMVAHALHVLGLDARIEDTAGNDLRALSPAYASDRAEDDPELGDGRVPEWVEHWASAIERDGWKATLKRATRELAPGILAGSLHGWIRAAHAARALDEKETPQRLCELAMGLAVWSSWYEELAEPIAGDPVAIDALLASIPRGDATIDGLIDARVARAAERDEVRRWAGTIAIAGEPEEVVTALSSAAARALLGAPKASVSGHLHGLTASSALRPLMPFIDWDALAPSFVHAFGALVAAHPHGEPATIQTSVTELRSTVAVVNDDHLIKLIEAALREHAATSDDVYLRAAARAVALRS